MKITSQPISRNELNEMLPGYFGDMRWKVKTLLNLTRYHVQDPAIRKRIIEVVNTLIK